MKGTTLLVALLLVTLTRTAAAETNSVGTSIRMLTVRGSAPAKYNRFLSEFFHVNTPHTQRFLKDFSIFAVRQGYDPYHPNGRFGALLISEGEVPIYFESMGEAAPFLSGRLGGIGTKEAAKFALRLLPDMFSYNVVTSPPLLHNGEPPEIEVPSDWPLIFEQTERGWSLTCTLLIDPVLASCNRVTLSLSRDGTLTVSGERQVYSQSNYL